jgi:hypothetical protein
MVRFDTDPGRPSDWLHEREWRVVVPKGALALEPAAVRAIIVGDESWGPDFVDVEVETLGYPREEYGDFTVGIVNELWPRLPQCWESKPRWVWSATEHAIVVLP